MQKLHVQLNVLCHNSPPLKEKKKNKTKQTSLFLKISSSLLKKKDTLSVLIVHQTRNFDIYQRLANFSTNKAQIYITCFAFESVTLNEMISARILNIQRQSSKPQMVLQLLYIECGAEWRGTAVLSFAFNYKNFQGIKWWSGFRLWQNEF